MIVKQFLDEVEQHFEDPVALRGIRKRAARDKSLSDDDRAQVDERIGMYLADHDGVSVAPGATPVSRIDT